MSATSTSTNTPYAANATTSSSPASPHDYVPTPTRESAASNESSFSLKEVLLYGGGLVLTAVVTYFSTLISVNSDISNNKESIAVLQSDVQHIKGDLESAEKDIEKNEVITSKVGIIEVKISAIEKQLDAHIRAVKNEKGITKK